MKKKKTERSPKLDGMYVGLLGGWRHCLLLSCISTLDGRECVGVSVKQKRDCKDQTKSPHGASAASQQVDGKKKRFLISLSLSAVTKNSSLGSTLSRSHPESTDLSGVQIAVPSRTLCTSQGGFEPAVLNSPRSGIINVCMHQVHTAKICGVWFSLLLLVIFTYYIIQDYVLHCCVVYVHRRLRLFDPFPCDMSTVLLHLTAVVAGTACTPTGVLRRTCRTGTTSTPCLPRRSSHKPCYGERVVKMKFHLFSSTFL